MANKLTDTPPVCDYEGSDYRTRFWENQGREYEDLTERIALGRMMPPTGDTLIEIGAGFGRLADEYLGYKRVVLFDYSRTLLREAQQIWGDDPRFIYVAGDWYKMPFVDGLFDTMVQIRTIHHAADVPSLFKQLSRIAKPNGDYVLEFANKQNLKAMLRHALGRQEWSPYTHDPIEFVELNFDFHPKYIREQLTAVKFDPQKTLTTSHYRLGVLKRTIPTPLLVWLDSQVQFTGKWWQLTPSVFIHSKSPTCGQPAVANTFFACPECAQPLQEETKTKLTCSECHLSWGCDNGLYDFKEPI